MSNINITDNNDIVLNDTNSHKKYQMHDTLTTNEIKSLENIKLKTKPERNYSLVLDDMNTFIKKSNNI